MRYEDLITKVVAALAPHLGVEHAQDLKKNVIDMGEPEVALEMALIEVDNPREVLGDELVQQFLAVTKPSDYLGKEIIELMA